MHVACSDRERERFKFIYSVIVKKIRKVIKMIENDGWYLARISGDHRQYKHKDKTGLVTISGHLDDDIGKGTLNSVLKQAGLKSKEEDSR